MCQTAKPQIEAEILDYLDTHPNAQDTLEGIVEWWLLRQRIAVATAHVKEALDELVELGLLTESRGGGSRTYYKANRVSRPRPGTNYDE